MRRIAIVQGEYAVEDKPDTMITTLLGSCVAVCLYDPVAHIGGMNHFLLGEPDPNHQVRAEDMHRYGVHAMELLINDMMRRGAVRDRLRAHVYGGGKIIAALGNIGEANSDFALRFLRTEGIPVGRSETGGTWPRKVKFLPYEGKARSVAVQDTPAPVERRAPAPVAYGDVELFA